MTRLPALTDHPVTFWLTGLSGAGKSTLAQALAKALREQGSACFVLDGDLVRQGLCRDLGFTPEDRAENIRRIAEVARLMNEAGLIVITAFISPYAVDRSSARTCIGHRRFLEVHLSTALDVCEQRDPKGLYGRARCGQLPDFTGISAPYEPPGEPELSLDTASASLDVCVQSCLGLLVDRG